MTDRRLSVTSAEPGPAPGPASRTAVTAAALTVTIGLGAASWVIAVRSMRGMDMGAATRLGSFPSFVTVWVVMMAAMMLPAAGPAVARGARASGQMRTVPLFIVSYLAVWAVVGTAVYVLYRPHGPVAAGAVTVAAGLYELTPLKRNCRESCLGSARSGLRYGLRCTDSSIGLMLMLVALGIMSITWMSVTAALLLAQKLLPTRTAVDVPLAMAIIGFGIWIIIAPSPVPGLMPPVM